MNLKPSVHETSSQRFTYEKNNQNPGLGRKTYGCRFWDADGVIYMDFIEPGTTVNSVLYCNTQNFEPMIKRSSAVQEERFAATWC